MTILKAMKVQENNVIWISVYNSALYQLCLGSNKCQNHNIFVNGKARPAARHKNCMFSMPGGGINTFKVVQSMISELQKLNWHQTDL